MEFLIYDLKVAALIAVFYMFYRLLLAKETLHRMNRVVLLGTAVTSFLLPLCVITMHETVVMKGVVGQVSFDGLAAVVEDEPQVPWWQIVLPVLYIIGMVATLAYTLISIAKVWLLIRNSELHPGLDDITVCVTGNEDVSPFSFGSYIVMNRKDYESHDAAIMAHESGHICQRHTLDVLLVDVLTALQWFNPAMWMLRQDLRAIHEYEADAAVLSQGINMRQYQYLLIQKAVSQCGYSVANGISHSTLKNRINMMLHKNSSRASLLKLLALTPIVGMTLALQAETVNDYVIEQPQNQTKVVKKGNQNAQVKVGTKKVEVKAVKPAAQAQTKAKKDATVKNVVVKAKKDAPTVSNVVVKTKKDPLAEGDVAIGVIDNDKDDRVWDVVEQMPKFPGGDAGLMDFLHKSIKYPAEAEKAGKQGRVVVVFVVGKDGAVNNAKVVRSVDEKLDAEALRVINAMPKWQPGKQNGQDVNVKFTLPVTFRLNKPAEKK